MNRVPEIRGEHRRAFILDTAAEALGVLWTEMRREDRRLSPEEADAAIQALASKPGVEVRRAPIAEISRPSDLCCVAEISVFAE